MTYENFSNNYEFYIVTLILWLKNGEMYKYRKVQSIINLVG